VSIYHDPSLGTERTNLIAGLMSVPAKPGLEPMENQLTHSLVWLLDHDIGLARAFGGLFIDDPEAAGVLAAATAIGARAQVSLPGGGFTQTLFPDLSLATAGRRLQLLVEVKPGADGFHSYSLDGQTYPQAEAYARAWAQRPAGAEALQRWVGTLTAGYQRPPELADLLAGLPVRRARDVSWQEVVELLERREREGSLMAGIRDVARDLCDVLRERVLMADLLPPAQELGALLDRGADLLSALRIRLAEAGLAPRSSGIQRRTDYVGTYVDAPLHDGDLEFWVQMSPRGGRYNLRGQPNALVVVAKRRDAPSLAEWGERFVPAGLRWCRDREGYPGYRALLEDEVVWADDRDVPAAAVFTSDWLLALLAEIRRHGDG
jgi:hypothetical protein